MVLIHGELEMIVRKLRLQRGWTQEQLAEFAGLSPRSIQRIERGYKPSLETAKALAAVFETECSQFQTGDNEMGSAHSLAEDEREAIEHVRSVKAFYAHLLIYIAVSVTLTTVAFALGLGDMGIDAGTAVTPEMQRTVLRIGWLITWLFGWGIGVVIHGLNAFEKINLFGPAWERKRIERRLGRKL
jgi:transcriptional regulator with XRE-family HTH domain